MAGSRIELFEGNVLDIRLRDDHVRRVDAVDGDEAMLRKNGLELPSEVQVDPTQQDRRHGPERNVSAPRLERVPPVSESPSPFELGLELIRGRRYFEAHEELELAWRAAAPEERDFFQGLVHVAVAWYQAGRGRPVATASQLEKAGRRLAPYTPHHRGVDVAHVLAQVEAAQIRVAQGSLALDPPNLTL